MLFQNVRPIEFSYKGEKITVNMPGWYPAEGDEGIFTRGDCKFSDKALRILKARHAAKMQENNSNFINVAFA